ncbi:MAG: TauD/TfdA family dioxygenase [Vicinamibacterales bacterium]
MIRRALTENFGYILEAEPGDALEQIETSDLRNLLLDASGGAILFRGFAPTEATFKPFSERHGADFVVHHHLTSRDYVAGDLTFATVNKDDYAIEFHNEMASSPVSPDLFWMLACRPARHRGRTGLVDGVAVARDLTANTRRHFAEKPLLFEYPQLPKSHWGALVPGRSERAGVEAWLSSVGKQRGVTEYTFDADENLSLKYSFRAIRDTRLAGLPAFCCGLLDAPEAYKFIDGSVPAEVCVTEVRQVIYQNAVWLDWQAGDVVLVDNTRVMHAREAFDDPQRRILVRYSGLRS